MGKLRTRNTGDRLRRTRIFKNGVFQVEWGNCSDLHSGSPCRTGIAWRQELQVDSGHKIRLYLGIYWLRKSLRGMERRDVCRISTSSGELVPQWMVLLRPAVVQDLLGLSGTVVRLHQPRQYSPAAVCDLVSTDRKPRIPASKSIPRSGHRTVDGLTSPRL